MILKNFFWKETILKTLLDRRKHNDFIFITVIALLFFSILFLTYRHIRNKNMYGQNFEDLMKKNEVTKVEVKNINKRVLNINKDTVASVLKQLEKFEKIKNF